MHFDEGFWLQLSARHREEILSLYREWEAADSSTAGIVLAPVTTHANLVEVARSCGDHQAYFDPCAYLLDREPTERARSHFPWLAGEGSGDAGAKPGAGRSPVDDSPQQRPRSPSEWLDWMRLSIDQAVKLFSEAERSPACLVAPCPLVASMVQDVDIDSVCEAFATLVSQYDSLIPSFCVESEFTRSEEGVTRLANAIVGLKPPAVLLRCFQSQLPPIADRRFLEGLREIVQACSANDIPVLLPNSGWVGWLARSWGEVQFSGGATQSSWFDRVPTPMSRPPQVDKIHDRQLITLRSAS